MTCWLCGSSIHHHVKPSDERRFARRYPVKLLVSGMFHDHIHSDFVGTSRNFSARGLLVESGFLVSPERHARALLSIAWPARLNGHALKLVLKTRLVWQDERLLAFKITRHEFRVLPLRPKAA